MKKQIVVERNFIVFLVLALLTFGLIALFRDDIELIIFLAVVGVMLLIYGALQPMMYVFERDSLCIRYVYGAKKTLFWREIDEVFCSHNKFFLYPLVNPYYYCFDHEAMGVDSLSFKKVYRTRRTKALMQEYLGKDFSDGKNAK